MGRYRGRGFTQEALQSMPLRLKLAAENGTGQFRHCVVTAGEHIDGCIARLGPGVNRDVGFRQQGQASHALRLELMGDQIQQRRTSALGG